MARLPVAPLLAPVLVATLACAREPQPIAWREPVALEAAAPGLAQHASLGFRADGAPALRGGGAPEPPQTPGACDGSLRVAHARAGEWHAAWWRARGDGRVDLVTARSDDGGSSWRAPVVADARDAGSESCARPAPAIAADSVTGYVHLVYYQHPAEGAGVWYTHSMDGGDSYHSTTGLVYGEEPVRASVASDGVVLVATYEIPHTRPTRVGIHLSLDGGHTFRAPLRLGPANAAATDPRAAVRGREVAVAWTEDGRNVARAGEVTASLGAATHTTP